MIIWKGPVPEIKYILWHLVENLKVLKKPTENLDYLVHLHFLNKKQETISENYISQSNARLTNTPKGLNLDRELGALFSNFLSN